MMAESLGLWNSHFCLLRTQCRTIANRMVLKKIWLKMCRTIAVRGSYGLNIGVFGRDFVKHVLASFYFCSRGPKVLALWFGTDEWFSYGSHRVLGPISSDSWFGLESASSTLKEDVINSCFSWNPCFYLILTANLRSNIATQPPIT